MSVGNVGSTGYTIGTGAQPYPSAAQPSSGSASSAGPGSKSASDSLYAAVTGLPGAQTMLLPPPVQGSAAGLIPAPGSAYSPQSLTNESNGQIAMSTAAAGAQAPHTASRVFYATLAVYGAFLTGVAGLLTVPAVLRSRGREPKFNFDPKADSANGKYRLERKKNAHKKAADAVANVLSGRKALQGTSLESAAAPKGSIPRNDNAQDLSGKTKAHTGLSLPESFDPAEHFIAPDERDVIEHNGWWTKILSDKKDAKAPVEEYLGYFAEGGVVNDRPVQSEHGEVVFASPLTIDKAKGAAKIATLEKIGFTHKGEFVASADVRRGKNHVLPVYRMALPQEESARLAVLHKLGISDDNRGDMLAELHSNRRLDKGQTHIFTANSWNDQFELQRGTRHVLSRNVFVKKSGQVRQRVGEFGGAAKLAVFDIAAAGNRVGLMLLSSTLLNALLVATAAVVSLGMVDHKHKTPADGQQN